MMEQITRCRYNFDDPVWENISSDAKDFISSLLQLDPNKRPTMAHAMKHRWLIRRIAAMWTAPEVGYVTPEEQKKMDEEIEVSKFKLQAINVSSDRSSSQLTATQSPCLATHIERWIQRSLRKCHPWRTSSKSRNGACSSMNQSRE